jgi:hypothetical protein
MSNKHELEIEISPKGDVQVHVKGAKGKQCLKYVELFNSLGPVAKKETTSEYYEPDPVVGLTDQMHTRWDG